MARERDIRQAEELFDQLLESVLFEVAETELTPEKRRERRRAADADVMAFAKTYFPNVFSAPFNDAHRHIASLKVGKYTISGFPQSGKSAFGYLAVGMHKIAMGLGGIYAVGCRDLDTARNRTKALSRILQSNKTLCYDYGISCVQDSAGYHIFKAEGGSTHLVAGSVSTGLRNIVDDDFKRIRFMILDDLYNKESVRSELDNLRVYEWVTGEAYRQMERDGLSLLFGNSINDGCPVRLLAKEFPDRHFSFPILNDKGESNWPERLDMEAIEKLKSETPSDIWHAEYLDDPLELGDQFQPEWLHTMRPHRDDILATIIAVDPAYGQSPESCAKAAFALAILKDHRVVCLGIRIRNEPYPIFFSALREMVLRLPKCKAILFENDFSQWAFAQPYYQEWLKQEETPLPIVMHNAKDLKTAHRAADKDSRIMNLVHPHALGQFFYDEDVVGTSDYEIYKRQFLKYGKHGRTKLDGLDAAATAYIMIRAYIDTGGFKPLGKRRHERPRWDKRGFH
jgi:hypothetical protein